MNKNVFQEVIDVSIQKLQLLEYQKVGKLLA